MSARRALGCWLVMGLGMACGGKPAPAPPEVIARDIPGIPEAPAPDAAIWAPPNPRQDAGPDVPVVGQCCPVRFAVARMADDVAGVLVGPDAPLAPQVSLASDGGAWEATVCMPLVDTTYRFVLGLPAVGTEDLLWIDTVNPNSPRIPSSLYGEVNVFRSAGVANCSALDTAPYGDTTQDAGIP